MQGYLIYYYFVPESMTLFAWLDVKNNLRSRNTSTALLQNLLRLLLLAGKSETLKTVKMAPPQ